MAISIAKAVNRPNKIVGTKLDKLKTENPKAIVRDVVNTAYPTLLCVFLIKSLILANTIYLIYILLNLYGRS